MEDLITVLGVMLIFGLWGKTWNMKTKIKAAVRDYCIFAICFMVLGYFFVDWMHGPTWFKPLIYGMCIGGGLGYWKGAKDFSKLDEKGGKEDK